MAGKSSAVETPVTPEAPAVAETPAPAPPGESAQEIIASGGELQKQIADATALIGKLTKERNDAIANALRADAQYKGLQNQTTKSLQKAAEDRRALALAQAQAAQIGDIYTVLNSLATKVLDEDEAKAFQWKQKELELNRREEALKVTPVVEEPVVTPQQYTTPVDEKAQFLSYYFPGVTLDPNDPNIDWATDAPNSAEAMRRFITSVMKVKDQQESTKANDAVATAQAQAAEQLKAVQKQIEDLSAKTTEEIAAAKVAAAEEARKEAEKRLRALGADVSGTPGPDGSGNKTFGQNLEEVLDDNLLKTKKGQEEYGRRVEAMNRQFRERFSK